MANELNEEIYKLSLSDFFISLTLICINRVQNKLQILNCGNPAALLIDNNNKVLARFESGEMPLGILPSGKFHPQVEEIIIRRPCHLYCYTDGLTDLKNSRDITLGEEAIERSLCSINSPLRFDELLTGLSDSIERNEDDITVLEIACEMQASNRIAASSAPAYDTAPAALIDSKILFVQDENRSQPHFLTYLQRRSGHLFYTQHYSEAVCLFTEFKPDLIILDIDLLRSDSLALIKLIRKSSLTVPIILFHEHDDLSEIINLLRYRINSAIPRQEKYDRVLSKLEDTLCENHELQRQKFSSLAFQYSDNAMIITDEHMKILSVNPAFSAVTGYGETDVIGRTPRILSSGRHGGKFYKRMWQAINEQGAWSGEIWNRRKNGEIYLEWLSINTVRDENGNIQNFIATFQDITQRKKAEKRINFLAYNDSLTGLSNRSLFHDRLSQWLILAKRNQRLFAILFLDLDHFKHVNDTLGHDVGDKLLQQVAQRMRRCLRKSDTIARLGGDEFAILLAEPQSRTNVAQITQKICAEIAQPVWVDGKQLHISTSIGITCFPDDGDSLEKLMKNADIAMYHAKENGRDNFEFYKAELNEELHRKIGVRNNLYNALNNEELQLHLQPKIDLASRQVVGAEALIRWTHPELGMIMPDQFIPIAEESGQIIALGEWIIGEACRNAARFTEN
nr:diguanylate cyclase [Methylomarinum sp. Ch1-1]MDP4521876.1 diguanylate cyclase [Methylomarinum sp. Ch1-1]